MLQTIMFSLDTSFDQVLEEFFEKANLRESKWVYGLSAKIGSEMRYLQPTWTLDSFPLPTPVSAKL
jgi:hypothetical protein